MVKTITRVMQDAYPMVRTQILVKHRGNSFRFYISARAADKRSRNAEEFFMLAAPTLVSDVVEFLPRKLSWEDAVLLA